MRDRVLVRVFLAVSTLACGVRAQSASPPAQGEESAAPRRGVGQANLIEMDALAGTFIGLRFKLLPYSGKSFNLALEVLDGASWLAEGGFLGLSATYGVGARIELYASQY